MSIIFEFIIQVFVEVIFEGIIVGGFKLLKKGLKNFGIVRIKK